MQDSMCIRCGSKIQIWKQKESIKCKECGAVYNLVASKLESGQVEFDYDFIGFNCIHTTLEKTCGNKCPAPHMYCKEHSSDDSLASARNSIRYAEERLEDAKETLDKMEESRKTWLIQEVSGLDAEDDSIREDEDGQD